MKHAVFCDFDGTITRRDVGYNMFRHFSKGANAELVEPWKTGQISTRECLRLEAAMVKASEAEVYAYLDTFELNRGFDAFASACRETDLDLIVISDGLDFYIEYILKRYDLGWIPVVTNQGRFGPDGLVVSFPHQNTSCQRCGSCKGERIGEYRERAGEPVRIAFIGDGYSDLCALEAADLIMAKKDLEEHCRHNIGHTPYDDFDDVVRCLQQNGYLNPDWKRSNR